MLDLGEARITEVLGLEMLVNLKFLDLTKSHATWDFTKTFSSTAVNEEEIASLKELETFACHFDDVDKFSTYITSLENRQLSSYQIQVGMWGDGCKGITPFFIGK